MENKQQEIEKKVNEHKYTNAFKVYLEEILKKPDGRSDKQIARENVYEKVFEMYDDLLTEDYPSKHSRIRAIARTLNIGDGLIWAALRWADGGCKPTAYRTVSRNN